MNNKGFMMAEVIVVSVIILMGMSVLYKSYNSIIIAYNKRVSYYDVATLYALADFRDDVQRDNGFESTTTYRLEANSPIGGYRNIVYLINTSGGPANINHLANVYGGTDAPNKTFKDYLNYIIDSETFEEDYILVMERCDNMENNKCSYAYLDFVIGGAA